MVVSTPAVVSCEIIRKYVGRVNTVSVSRSSNFASSNEGGHVPVHILMGPLVLCTLLLHIPRL